MFRYYYTGTGWDVKLPVVYVACDDEEAGDEVDSDDDGAYEGNPICLFVGRAFLLTYCLCP